MRVLVIGNSETVGTVSENYKKDFSKPGFSQWERFHRKNGSKNRKLTEAKDDC
jgi:hypothetical protein